MLSQRDALGWRLKAKVCSSRNPKVNEVDGGRNSMCHYQTRKTSQGRTSLKMVTEVIEM